MVSDENFRKPPLYGVYENSQRCMKVSMKSRSQRGPPFQAAPSPCTDPGVWHYLTGLLGVKAHIKIGGVALWVLWDPVLYDRPELLPIHSPPLAASPKRLKPVTDDFCSERFQGWQIIRWYRAAINASAP